jgi:hypothetical protein
MKLYTDGIGNWLGTQADAKLQQILGTEVKDVN